MAIGNEFSDHILETAQLSLPRRTPSCATARSGPELVLDADFSDVARRGRDRARRRRCSGRDRSAPAKPRCATASRNMEHHHFKYASPPPPRRRARALLRRRRFQLRRRHRAAGRRCHERAVRGVWPAAAKPAGNREGPGPGDGAAGLTGTRTTTPHPGLVPLRHARMAAERSSTPIGSRRTRNRGSWSCRRRVTGMWGGGPRPVLGKITGTYIVSSGLYKVSDESMTMPPGRARCWAGLMADFHRPNRLVPPIAEFLI